MTLTKEILNSHPASTLKKEISKTNIKGYSKMKKGELVELMMKNKERFGHIRMKGKGPAEKPKGKGPAKATDKPTAKEIKEEPGSLPKKGSSKKVKISDNLMKAAEFVEKVLRKQGWGPLSINKEKGVIQNFKYFDEDVILETKIAKPDLIKEAEQFFDRKKDIKELKRILEDEAGPADKPKGKGPAKKPKASAPQDDPKQYSFDYYYTGGGGLNSYLNDLMDSRNPSNGRKLGFTRAKSAGQKYLNKMKKEKKSVSKEMLKEHLESIYGNYE
jgi:hypothetical protein